MRIYFIGQKGIPGVYGGVERHVDELATRLASQGNEVFVYVRNYFTPADLKEYKGVKLIHLPSIKTKHLDAISHTILAVLDVLRRDADIIHFHAIGPSSLSWIPRLLKRKAKIITTFHSDDRKHEKWGWFAKKCLGFGAYISTKIPHKTIAVSKTQQEDIFKEFKQIAEYIPNGVPSYPLAEADYITQKWGLKQNDYILAVSRLIRHKGIHHLIRAYSMLKNPGKKLVITGGPTYTDSYVKYLKKLAADNPNIIFTGDQKGQILAELYSNAYLFVQPSEAEGLSICLLEAMSYGKVCLVSNIEPNLEAVSDYSFTFRNKSVTDLAQKLHYFLENPDEFTQTSKKLQERALSEYNWDNIVTATYALYESAREDGKKVVAAEGKVA